MQFWQLCRWNWGRNQNVFTQCRNSIKKYNQLKTLNLCITFTWARRMHFWQPSQKEVCHKARNVSVNVEVISRITFSPKIATLLRHSVGSHKLQNWQNSQKKSTIGRFFFQCPKQIIFHKFFSKKSYFTKIYMDR